MARRRSTGPCFLPRACPASNASVANCPSSPTPSDSAGRLMGCRVRPACQSSLRPCPESSCGNDPFWRFYRGGPPAKHRYPRPTDPAKERFVDGLGSRHEVFRCGDESFVNRLHSLACQRPGVLDSLRSIGVSIRSNDASRPIFLFEIRVLWVVVILGFLLGVEIVKIPKELVEATAARHRHSLRFGSMSGLGQVLLVAFRTKRGRSAATPLPPPGPPTRDVLADSAAPCTALPAPRWRARAQPRFRRPFGTYSRSRG